MESAQVIAAFIAGLVVPFVQEILFGAKISGRIASLVTVGTTLVIATIATWVSGGFAGAVGAPAFDFIDPSAFFGFWVLHVFAPVYGLSQFVYGITTKHGAESPPATGPIQSVAASVQPVIGTS